LFHKLNKDLYVYSERTGWYSYDEFNILVSHGKTEPPNMLNRVSKFLQSYIKEEMDNTNVFDDISKKYFDDLFKAYSKISTSSYVKGIIPYLPTLFLDDKLDDKIDADSLLIAFKNKVYDVNKGYFRDIEKKDYILRNTGYEAPNDISDYSLIDDLVMSIFEDREVADYYLLITALSLITNKFEKLYILTGNGRNGKGVLSSIVEKALGNYYLAGANDLLTIKDEMKNETLAKSTGIRYLAISEPAEDNDKELKFNVSTVKKLTGRDRISTRALYKNSFEFVPQFTMFVSCNKQPSIDETNDAIRNRFRFIHFPFTFVENPTKSFERQLNVDLKDNIESDTRYRDVMICYLLELLTTNKNIKKINEPEKCKAFTKDYFDNEDDIGNFIEKYFERVVYNDGTSNLHKIRPSELFSLYNADGEYKRISNVKFAYGLKAMNINSTKISGSKWYVGLKKKIIEEEESETENDNKSEQPKKNSLDL
jgi:P4 family phage/plasmid primase-like protien